MHHSIVTRHPLGVTACDLEVQLAQCAMMRQTPKITDVCNVRKML